MHMSAGSVGQLLGTAWREAVETSCQHLGAGLDPVGTADVDELGDGLAKAAIHEVVPEDAWRARVHEDVCVRLMQVTAGERPVIQRGPCGIQHKSVIKMFAAHRCPRTYDVNQEQRQELFACPQHYHPGAGKHCWQSQVRRRRHACVMIVNEGHGPGWPHAEDTGRAALVVAQPPVLPTPHRLLQDACSRAAQHHGRRLLLPWKVWWEAAKQHSCWTSRPALMSLLADQAVCVFW
jgi:hypothetical protein